MVHWDAYDSHKKQNLSEYNIQEGHLNTRVPSESWNTWPLITWIQWRADHMYRNKGWAQEQKEF